MASTGEDGSALLVAVGAGAALAAMATWLLVIALSDYEAAGYRAERAQAGLIASAVLDQACEAVSSRSLPLPVGRTTIVVLNGARMPGGERVPVGRIPRPESAAGWPVVSTRPWVTGGSEPDGVGTKIEVRAVLGPRGDARGRCLGCRNERLYTIDAEAWYRRGLARRAARIVVDEDGTVTRLD